MIRASQPRGSVVAPGSTALTLVPLAHFTVKAADWNQERLLRIFL